MLAALVLPILLPSGAEPPADAVKLNEPRVQYRQNEASATSSPWIDANGWRIFRDPGKTFAYRVKGENAALAAAEAFSYGAGAVISADAAGADAFARMIEFIKTIPAADLRPAADFGVIDDGSDLTGELLNLLTRMNLFYRTETNPDPKFHLNVRLGTKEFPKEEASNPAFVAQKVRSLLGDDHRSLRVYGSQVVIARFLEGPRGARVFLLNYSTNPVLGLRVRLRGDYSKGDLHAYKIADASLTDWTRDGPMTEFTVPELRVFAVVDLSR
jgi:hypothetical protein